MNQHLAIRRFKVTTKVTSGIVVVFQVTRQKVLLVVDKSRVFHFELELRLDTSLEVLMNV